MVMWCISAEVPVNKFDDPCFAPMMESLQPTFSGLRRQTMHNDSVSRFKRISQGLKVELQALNSRICFTSNLWTSNQYIDANFILKKTIAFKDVKYPHNGFVIEEAITRCLIEWGIKEKVFTITLDNASNNRLAIDLLQENGASDMIFDGEHLHVRCCAHILNLLVQDGMAVAHGAIDTIRELVRHINSSPSRIQVFKGIAEGLGLPSKAGLTLDILNCWN
jgi:uncharacterized protein YegP (UPF0339 family)